MGDSTIIMGAGLAGLSAGYTLSDADKLVRVFESDLSTGGLAKTIVKNGYRFDLGGHRFFTENKTIETFVKNLLGKELLIVPRSSKIYLLNKYFDYPLRPANALFGLGPKNTLKILSDYLYERIKGHIRASEPTSLEEWVTKNFGRTMFNIYFKEYSEKVWGIPCDRISSEWVSQRIKGLSLGTAIKNAFLRFRRDDLPTLADRFLYPASGIGMISAKLEEYIKKKGNEIHTGCKIERIQHTGRRIENISVRNCNTSYTIKGSKFISTIPMTTLINSLSPAPPEEILRSASFLRYRGLVVCTIMINRRRVTDQTWIYLPEKKIPFGRIHEPTNWSYTMAPGGKTLIVAEYFCSEGDDTWNLRDSQLIANTAHHLEKMGFIKREEVLEGVIVRIPKAYPILDTDYRRHYLRILDYLSRFINLFIAGRVGLFRYYNMDLAIESGMEAAKKSLLGIRP